MKPRHSKWGLALGGGGARGIAHVGVLKVLQREGLIPDVITGTSIGALVGAPLPVGRMRRPWKHASMKSWPLTAVKTSRSSRSLGSAGWIKLNPPCSTVCSVLLDKGSIIEAVMASCAVPGFMPPVAVGEALLMDGGLADLNS